jgi:hypothetical protein
VPDGWTHPRWPGRPYKSPVHQAAQINQISAHDGGDVATHLGIPNGGSLRASQERDRSQKVTLS